MKIKVNDIVYWNDPYNLQSGYYVISSIFQIKDNEKIVFLLDKNNNFLCCNESQIKLVK